jgi:hypothetical protein
LDVRIEIVVVGAAVHHAQSAGLPDGFQAILIAPCGVGQDFTEPEVGEALAQFGEAGREEFAFISDVAGQ